MFDSYPTYDRYRPLKKGLRGEDVYALQTGLFGLAFSLGAPDGIFGPITEDAVKRFQESRKLVSDGIAGPTTQRRVCVDLITKSTRSNDLPHLLLYGQVEHESSFIVGNYSQQYSDGSFDAGAVQRNTRLTSPQDGFNTAQSIEVCGNNCRDYYNKFMANAELSEARRWGLAAAAWNAPAFASYLAKVKPWAVPSQSQIDALESYIDSVTKYMKL